MNKSLSISPLLGFLLFLGMGTAQAVNLSPNGVGQVLIAPYYNVENGNETILSITNISDQAKAVRVAIREADNGQVVLSFNLYLSPFDMWSAKISDDGNNGAQVVTYDSSCAVPAFTFAQAVGFDSAAYQNDGGDTSIARTREGFVEVIEMGNLTAGGAEALAVLHDGSGNPANCSLVVDNWAPAGKWDLNANDGIESPTSGLKATASIINVGQGMEYELPITTLDNFSAVALHFSPDSSLPNLASATARSTLFINSNDDLPVYNDQWGTRGIDAVSAVLMKQQLLGDFSVNPAVETQTEWVLSFPTKYFYTQNSPVAPFVSRFGIGGTPACEPVSAQSWDREEQTGTGSLSSLCYAVNVVQFGSSDILKAIRTTTSFTPGISNGWASIAFAQSMTASGGFTYQGLPVIGFAVKYAGNGWVGLPYASVTPLSSPPVMGSRRVFIQAGQSAISSFAGYGDDITFISTVNISTQGNLSVSNGKRITFMAPVVSLNQGFSVGGGGMFRVVSTNP